MNNGIIQEVFKQWKEKHDFFAWQLTKMEQELIERIKQIDTGHESHDKPFNDDYCIGVKDFKRKLIGDNRSESDAQ